MSDLAIRVENLSKQYQIGAAQPRYYTLRDQLTEGARRLLRRADRAPENNTIWALRDVSFDVKQGEVLGIIGRNGAGKSTLLKILSRITEPTSGRALVYGRVGSLLEVGTGFHPELTGRENITLNGAILGMSKAEIDRKFDEIVDFAEIEKFIDTPVKRYSSGMYVRLAFAVAAHLEPEILLVDEVLAVGDAEFQKKCLGKMGEVAHGGRTVLFVSHNMGAVRQLCTEAILLDNGQIQVKSTTQIVVEEYLSRNLQLNGTVRFTEGRAQSSTELSFIGVRILDSNHRQTSQIGSQEGLFVELEYIVRQPLKSAQIAFELWNSLGECVLSSTDFDTNPDSRAELKLAGRYTTTCFIPPEFIRPGNYSISVSSSIPGVRALDEIRHAIAFEVVDTGSIVAKLGQGRRGTVTPILDWQTVNLIENED